MNNTIIPFVPDVEELPRHEKGIVQLFIGTRSNLLNLTELSKSAEDLDTVGKVEVLAVVDQYGESQSGYSYLTIRGDRIGIIHISKGSNEPSIERAAHPELRINYNTLTGVVLLEALSPMPDWSVILRVTRDRLNLGRPMIMDEYLIEDAPKRPTFWRSLLRPFKK
jgi:hypothetical protein